MIDHSSWQWDSGKLAATFTPRTCKQILSLPLNHLDSQDTLVWTENKANTFSVKTAYRVALRLKSVALAEHSSVRAHGVTWGKIGSSMYLLRCEHLCGGHAQTVYQPRTTCAVERSRSRQHASSAARNLKQLLIYSGSACSQEMYGRWLEGVYKNAATTWWVFSCYSNTCRKRWSR